MRSSPGEPRPDASAEADSPVTSIATAWRKWFSTIERAAAPLTRRMIALASLGEDYSLLDIGTGIGEPAVTAARAVPHGHVLAIDPDPEMIDIARERALSAQLGNITFHVQRAEELNLPARSIDAVLSRWSLMFVDDLDATLSMLHRLLRPGGRFIAASWGPPERVPALSLARAVIHRHFGIDPPACGSKTAFALADNKALAETFRAAGFSDVVQETVRVPYEFPSVQSYLQFRTDCTGPLFSAVGSVSPAERDGALEAVAAALQSFRTEQGSYRLASDAYCTAATATGR